LFCLISLCCSRICSPVSLSGIQFVERVSDYLIARSQSFPLIIRERRRERGANHTRTHYACFHVPGLPCGEPRLVLQKEL
jgi:hypothetical protein